MNWTGVWRGEQEYWGPPLQQPQQPRPPQPSFMHNHHNSPSSSPSLGGSYFSASWQEGWTSTQQAHAFGGTSRKRVRQEGMGAGGTDEGWTPYPNYPPRSQRQQMEGAEGGVWDEIEMLIERNGLIRDQLLDDEIIGNLEGEHQGGSYAKGWQVGLAAIITEGPTESPATLPIVLDTRSDIDDGSASSPPLSSPPRHTDTASYIFSSFHPPPSLPDAPPPPPATSSSSTQSFFETPHDSSSPASSPSRHRHERDTQHRRAQPRNRLVSKTRSPSLLANARAEGGLYMWTNATRWLAVYERYGWMFTPLHPSVLSEDSLRSMSESGSSRNGLASPFPISDASTAGPAVFELNVNTALAYGAMLIGDDEQAEGFFQRARAALEGLLDVDDYAVAEALSALSYYLFGRGDMARFSYYTTLAKDICRRIGACNSGVFLKCMLATSLDPSYTPTEKERTLRRYNRAIKDTPRWDDHHDRFLVDYNSQQLHHRDDVDEYRRTAGAGAITLGLVVVHDRELTAGDVLETVARTRDIDKCVTNVFMLIELHQWIRKEADAGRSLGPEAVDVVLQQWGRLLVVMQEEIQKGESLPKPYKLTVSLTWLCFSAIHALRCGNTEEAIRLGALFQEWLKDEDLALCVSSCINMIELMMDLYFECDRDDMVESLLVHGGPLLERYPVCRERTVKYRARLEERAIAAAARAAASSPGSGQADSDTEEPVWPSPASLSSPSTASFYAASSPSSDQSQ